MFTNRLKSKLIWQIVPVLLLVLVPTLLIGGYFACVQVRDFCLNEQKTDLSHATAYVGTRLESNPNHEWLLNYWSENAEQLDAEMIYDDQAALNAAERRFTEMNPGLNASSITPKELSELDQESADLYALICLMDTTLAFDQMKTVYNLKFIYLTRVYSPEEEIFLISGYAEGDTRGFESYDIFRIGKKESPGFEYHPVLERIFYSHSKVDEFEKKEKKGRTGFDYNVYYPFFTGDGATYILCGCKSADNVMKTVYNGAKLVVISFLLMLLLGTVMMILAFHRVLLRPLSLVQRQIRKYTMDKKEEDLATALGSIRHENEIGQLAHDVARLASELTRYTEEVGELSAENQRIETELNLARSIQKAALPDALPVFEKPYRFDLAGQMNPAKEVGGDFFDYFQLDEDHLAIIIADVSGKGVPAAMFMMVSHICIKNMCSALTDPGQIFEKVNDVLMERNLMEMFVTSWFGILDLRTGEIRCVNAGHEYPAIARAGEDFTLLKTKHGFVLAGMEGTKYRTETLQLNKGDTLFLYTDGVAEATNSEDVLFGTDRMLESLNRNRTGSCQEILESMKNDIDRFVGDAPQFDDLTMVCFRYQ